MNWKYILIVFILAVVVGGGIYWWSRISPEVPQPEVPQGVPTTTDITGRAYIIFSTGTVVDSESEVISVLKSNRASIQEAINRKLQEVNWILPEELDSDLAELTVFFDRYSIEKRGWKGDGMWPFDQKTNQFFKGELFVILMPVAKEGTSWTLEDNKIIIGTTLVCQQNGIITMQPSESVETGEIYCPSPAELVEKKVVAPNIKLLVNENGVIYLGGFQVGGSL